MYIGEKLNRLVLLFFYSKCRKMSLANALKLDIYWHNVREVCIASKKLIREFERLKNVDFSVAEFLRLFDLFDNRLDMVMKKHEIIFIGGSDDIFENLYERAEFLLQIANKKR
jgi:hypothetical protein